MWRNLLVASATLVALSGSVQANTITFGGPGTASFQVVGDNSNPSATGTFSLGDINITPNPPIPGDPLSGGGSFSVGAILQGALILSAPPNILLGETTQVGADFCRDLPCQTSINFLIPTGQLDLPLSVTSTLAFFDAQVGSPPFTLSLSVPDPLQVGSSPLPAALPLFATGLGALGLLGWRRKRKARISSLRVT
jgi:hypothetical protein